MKEDKKSKKRAKIFFIIMAIFCLGMFIHSVIQYAEYNVSYGNFKCEELTFVKYKVNSGGRGSEKYEFYFKEHNEVFYVDSIARKEIDKNVLSKVKSGDTVKIYYRDNRNILTRYEYEIGEIRFEGRKILALSDYKNANQKNHIIGMIIFSIMCVCCVVLLIIFSKV